MTAGQSIMADNKPAHRKTERLAVRLPEHAKNMLEQAAEMTGRSVSDFVLGSAVDAASKTISDFERMRLSERDQAAFTAALANPPAPNAALRAAEKLHRKLSQ